MNFFSIRIVKIQYGESLHEAHLFQYGILFLCPNDNIEKNRQFGSKVTILYIVKLINLEFMFFSLNLSGRRQYLAIEYASHELNFGEAAKR